MQRPNYTQFLEQKGLSKSLELPVTCYTPFLSFISIYWVFYLCYQVWLCSLINRCKCEAGLLVRHSVFLLCEKEIIWIKRTPQEDWLGTLNISSGQETSKHQLLASPSGLHMRFFLSVHPTPPPRPIKSEFLVIGSNCRYWFNLQ